MDFLAVYGAVLATLVAVWSIYRAITDRGRLRVTLGFGDLVQGGSTRSTNENHRERDREATTVA